MAKTSPSLTDEIYVQVRDAPRRTPLPLRDGPCVMTCHDEMVITS